jgi:regulator of chromosome condensation
VSCGGLHNAVLTEDGHVYTWGCSDDGSLGRPGDESMPALVTALADQSVISVACGDGQTIAVTTEGHVWGWGTYKDKEGTKFFNPAADAMVPHKDISKQQDVPIRIQGLSGVVEVACGSAFNLARCDDGRVYSWGLGENGELGREVPPLKTSGKNYLLESILKHHITPGPMFVSGSVNLEIRNAKAIGCGSYHALVVAFSSDQSGTKGVRVFSTGLNNYGQLGHGDKTNRPLLEEIRDLSDVGAVSAKGGMHHSLVLAHRGIMYAFGRSDSYQVRRNEP